MRKVGWWPAQELGAMAMCLGRLVGTVGMAATANGGETTASATTIGSVIVATEATATGGCGPSV
eukprot:scaffold185211_cov32-Tisochrysis_lutea.AAC.2